MQKGKSRKSRGKGHTGYSRRNFLKVSKNIAFGSVIVGVVPGMCTISKERIIYPVSEGYLLVDRKKCQGCMSCMLACSLAHEGKESLSLARIQVIQDSFEQFPDDLALVQCRQCLDPECLKACPAGALDVDSANGNIRRVDRDKCIGCMSCIEACPHYPGRAIWNHNDAIASKCDLCLETPYWKEEGGPGGKQCCVEVCPVGAIKFTEKMPQQKGDKGYQVNLRGGNWRSLGYPG